MSEVIHPPDEAQLIARAVIAYGLPCDVRRCTVRELAGRQYVVLYPTHRGADDGLPRGVYRVHNNGRLRQMIEPPPELLGGES